MHKVEYNGKVISYNLEKAKIKNIYIKIKKGNVIVRAPIRVKEDTIEKFVMQQANWINKKISEYEKRPKVEEKIEEKDIKKLAMVVDESIKEYSNILNVSPKKVRIKDIKYAWGSCSSNKNISISVHLAKKEENTIKYVVLHEMCHLIHMNHSKQFWNLVEKNMPNYKEYKKELKV